jgi:hypothetical protein
MIVLTAVYIVSLRVTIDVSRTDLGRSPETRDVVYLVIHSALMLVTVVSGFIVGRILSGHGLAFTALFLMLALTMMATVQIGSFSLACNGHNDLIRHWTC